MSSTTLRGRTLVLILTAIVALTNTGCGGWEEEGTQALTERMITGAGLDEDMSGDLRPQAKALIIARNEERSVADVPAQSAAQPIRLTSFDESDVPATIRVWRRRLAGSTSSCSGRVDTIPLETYVKGVLPHEWIRSWHVESLKAGSVAIRTYGSWWVTAGGKYACADVDDTTASQVYKDVFYPVTDDAVDATTSTFVVKSGALVFAQYSAENGDPTLDGVSEPFCAGYARRGHGRGTCQWGSQRWASQAGKSFSWIMTHYYPGSSVVHVQPQVGNDAVVVDSNNANNDPVLGYVSASSHWRASSATPGYYGTGYYFASTAPISDPVQFFFYLDVPAIKTVEAWWTAGSNRAPAAPFIIVDSTGAQLDIVRMDQIRDGSRWNTLGTWSFPAGWNKVMLSRWTTSGAVVIADAVRIW